MFADFQDEQSKHGGIYIHVPFCIKKCPYCYFYSITDNSLMPAYVQYVAKEINMTSDVLFSFDTIYFGGGTPSLLNPGDIEKVLNAVFKKFKIISRSEITLEVNPGTITLEILKDFKSAGINRINIGIQSFNDENLKFLGRIHTAGDAKQTIDLSRKAGFSNIGFDLIYGLPGQSKIIWREDLKNAVDSGAEHLSCYMLTYEKGTKIDHERMEEKFEPLSDEKLKFLFEETIEFLDSHNYFHYEISNFAKKEFIDSKKKLFNAFCSRHNRKYWSFFPYLGFGPSAHSFIEPFRCWNVRSVNHYMEAITYGKMPVQDVEELTREQQIIEAIYLGLRTYDGINIKWFNKKFAADFEDIFEEVLEKLKGEKFISISEERCFLTKKGMLLLDSIAGLMVGCLKGES